MEKAAKLQRQKAEASLTKAVLSEHLPSQDPHAACGTEENNEFI